MGGACSLNSIIVLREREKNENYNLGIIQNFNLKPQSLLLSLSFPQPLRSPGVL